MSSYDPIAGMYHAQWDAWYLPAAVKALERLFFSAVPAGASVLDVCCGSGHVTRELVRCGYKVTGLDLSGNLIQHARASLPDTEFYIRDVRSFDLGKQFDAALSTFDSFNHLLTLEDLQHAMKQVRAHLKKGGLFLFDMNLEEAYFQDLRAWTVTAKDEMVSLVRGVFEPRTQLASTELIQFVREPNEELWRCNRSVVKERCYTKKEITRALKQAGFKEVSEMPALEAGVRRDVAYGRVFFSGYA